MENTSVVFELFLFSIESCGNIFHPRSRWGTLENEHMTCHVILSKQRFTNNLHVGSVVSLNFSHVNIKDAST